MLKLTIPPQESFDERTNRFVQFNGVTVTMEHSLVSISKWEARWQKPFFDTISRNQISGEEFLDYIHCMIITQNIKPEVLHFLSDQNIQDIISYFNNPMTATTFSDNAKNSGGKRIVTAEVIYSQMIELGIPIEFQKWPINRLITLIRVRQIREEEASGKGKKMSKSEIISRNRALNAARKKKYNTKG